LRRGNEIASPSKECLRMRVHLPVRNACVYSRDATLQYWFATPLYFFQWDPVFVFYFDVFRGKPLKQPSGGISKT
jgi:hypothetical protein